MTGAGKVVVGVDGSLASAAALRWAMADARRRRCDLQAVFVWGHGPLGEVVDTADEARRELDLSISYALGPGPYPVRVIRSVLRGRPGPALVALSTDAELLVVGCRGHGFVGSVLLGSVSQFCARHAQSPLTIVPTPDDVLTEHVFAEGEPGLVSVEGSARAEGG